MGARLVLGSVSHGSILDAQYSVNHTGLGQVHLGLPPGVGGREGAARLKRVKVRLSGHLSYYR